MDRHAQIHQLQQYTDLSESVIGEVIKANKRNKSLTQQFLEETHRETLRQRNAAVEELHQQLQLVSKEEIQKALEASNWNIGEAIIPLMQKLDELRQQLKETNPAGVALSTSSNRFDCGQPITIEYKVTLVDQISCLSSRCWIGLYKVNTQNKQYITYQWADFSGKETGKATFYAPNEFGSYEFKFFYGDKGYQHAVISGIFQVGPEFSVEGSVIDGKIQVSATQISGNAYSRAWIGLYEKDQSHYVTWDWFKPQLAFDLPSKKGVYELRVFCYRYEHVATSAPIHIE